MCNVHFREISKGVKYNLKVALSILCAFSMSLKVPESPSGWPCTRVTMLGIPGGQVIFGTSIIFNKVHIMASRAKEKKKNLKQKCIFFTRTLNISRDHCSAMHLLPRATSWQSRPRATCVSERSQIKLYLKLVHSVVVDVTKPLREAHLQIQREVEMFGE